MQYAFLPEDIEALKAKLNNLDSMMDDISLGAGGTLQQAADTTHDNFGFEDGKRQGTMWGEHGKRLLEILNNAKIVTPNPENNWVTIGKIVTYEEINGNSTSGEKRIKIGSYMVINDQQKDRNGKTVYTISYASPLGKLFIMGKIGQTKQGFIGDKMKKIKIIEIENC